MVDTAFLVLKMVKSPLSNNNSLPDNSNRFHNNKVNSLKATQINKAAEIIVEMALSTPQDSPWRL